MITNETFIEMLEKIDDKDFILKVIQANVILCKSAPIEEDFESPGNYVQRLVIENAHNDIKKEHYDYALDIFEYENFKSLEGLGSSKPKFPLRKSIENR